MATHDRHPFIRDLYDLFRLLLFLGALCLASFPRVAAAARINGDSAYSLGLGYPIRWVEYYSSPGEKSWELNLVNLSFLAGLYCCIRMAYWLGSRIRTIAQRLRSGPSLEAPLAKPSQEFLLRDCVRGLLFGQLIFAPLAAIYSYNRTVATGPNATYIWAGFYTVFFLLEWIIAVPCGLMLGVIAYMIRGILLVARYRKR